MDVRANELLLRQEGVVSRWQLRAAGLTESQAWSAVAGLRRVGSGVWVSGHAAVTRRQLRWAAVLGAPDRALSHASAAGEWGIREWSGGFEVVTVLGSGGPRRHGDVLICRSRSLDATTLGGLPITSVERTVIDLAAALPASAAVKAAREAIRLGLTDAERLLAACRAGRGRRGIARLRAGIEPLVALPISRCRSDAEAHGLQVIADARLPMPRVNARIAGLEADLSWPQWRLIIEIDGAAFHPFADDDARRTAVWRKARWHVGRVPASVVFDDPGRFLATIRAERTKAGVLVPADVRSA